MVKEFVYENDKHEYSLWMVDISQKDANDINCILAKYVNDGNSVVNVREDIENIMEG